MGFLWVNGLSFFHCVASPFHSFVTTAKGGERGGGGGGGGLPLPHLLWHGPAAAEGVLQGSANHREIGDDLILFDVGVQRLPSLRQSP